MTDIQQSSIRELSLDEIDSVGGGSFWGRVAHGFKGLAKDVDEYAIPGAVGGGVAGAFVGPEGIIPGAGIGLASGAAAGATVWALHEIGV